MATTTTTDGIRIRRERLQQSRLNLAVRCGVSPSWLAALEAGLRPHDSPALTRVLAVLDELEREAARDRFAPVVAAHCPGCDRQTLRQFDRPPGGSVTLFECECGHRETKNVETHEETA